MPTPIRGQSITAPPKVDATLSNTSSNTVQNQAVANALAGAYDATATYAVGDLCIYDGILYECTTAITTAEAWDATHWKTGNFGEKVSDLNRHLSDLEDTVSTTQIINSASGAIASFDDGADGQPIRKLVAQIEPVQDLHGYDSPWPAGGGKNKVNYSAAFPIVSNGITISQNDDGSISINGTATANTNQILMAEVAIDNGAWTISGVPTNSAGGNLSIWARNTVGGTEYERTYNGLPGTLNISTGSVYIYCTISSGTTVDNVKVYLQLESGNTATAWSPYENLCPISGHTGAEIEQTGKNLAYVFDDGYVPSTSTGQLVQYSGARTDYIKIEPSKPYYAKVDPSTEQFFILFYDANKGFISYNAGTTYISVTSPSNAAYAMLRVSETQLANSQIQLEQNNQATSYAPYTGNQISVNWQDTAGTIYDGSVEAIGGALKSTMGMVDLGDLNWNRHSSSGNFFATISDIKPFETGITQEMLSSMYRRVSDRSTAYAAPDGSMCRYNSSDSKVVIFSNSNYETASDFKAAMSGVQLCYELATPAEYTLTANELNTLYGTNNVWIDTGSITECTYHADTKLYIDGLTAPDEDMIADANIASGKYFVVNNQLYLSTAAIAAGASIVPGTNCTATNLAEALNAINT